MKEIWKEIRRSFFAGLLVVVPGAVSIGVLWWVFATVTNWLLPAALRTHEQTLLYRVVAVAIFALLMTSVGWVTRLVVGKQVVAALEKVISRVPLLNKTYGFMKEISDTMLAGQKTIFERVVLVEYPRPGIYTLAFATAETGGEPCARTGNALVSVFLPTPPNPTTGYLALFPRQRVIDLEMSVSDAMKMSFSGGAVVPPYPLLAMTRAESA